MISSTRQALACIFVFFSVAVIAHAQITPATEPGATITGKVTMKGKGVPGIVVTLRTNNSSGSGREYSGPKGVSDDDGNYRIVNVTPGNYRVIPVARTFVPAEDVDREKVLIVSKSDTIEHIDFAVLGGGVITGKVVDAEGRPVVEETVYVLAGSGNGSGNVYQQSYSQTDDRGVYRIYGLRPGSYKVAAGRGEEFFTGGVPRPYKRTFHPSVEDPIQATVVEVIEGGETKDVDVTFSRRVSTYSANGRVVDGETGQPLPNVGYGITRYETGGSSSRSDGSVTNSRGEFKFDSLAPGKYAVSPGRADDSDIRFEDLRFEITDQDVTGLEVKTTKGGSVSGVIIFEDFDIKTLAEQNRVFINASTEGGGSRNSSARVGEDGSFHLRGLAAGTVNFFVYANQSIRIDHIERDGVIQPQGIVLREREQLKGIRIVAHYGSASIRGKIEVQNGSLPPDGRFYYWIRKVGDEQSIMYSGANNPAQVDARGNFAIERLTPGTYEIESGVYVPSAKKSYAATKKEQVVVTAGSVTNLTMLVDLGATPYKQP